MTDAASGELDIDPRKLRAGDVLVYMVRDYLMRPGAPLIHGGVWEVLPDDPIKTLHVTVDEEGQAYEVEALWFNCRSLEGKREEWKLFPRDRCVRVRRRGCG
ncbi:hypothetical protein HNP84_010067 [Thermocatellispora tengchongensis]|uniref:Uncharacterized protein n=1 Tax=Thermocatellispora tengchongensis TaxID=1073253 RepID=A0A840PR82_9ACTN|nr:hypothetical protein [Thermocatellispora tengchongensis]MBB5140300.1 hypothetical protein [Thermocatellispora tengchongensis]